MGNCIRKESAMQWAGEDWGSPASESPFSGERGQERSSHGKFTQMSAAAAQVTEVKIKITKKQLAELVKKMERKELLVEEVVALLVSAGDGFEAHHRPWKPALQSIAE
ncbi:uncharacterized protein LOC127792257 [Diospyros lotus]|uniref:uncharacterized protein LOC127792257 n=1 Tax=Diospyros lotus TaxID=55363 RepID=UPI00225A3F41|nr:uncharacterized protein LOC127792257 [Diospyros lotus]